MPFHIPFRNVATSSSLASSFALSVRSQTPARPVPVPQSAVYPAAPKVGVLGSPYPEAGIDRVPENGTVGDRRCGRLQFRGIRGLHKINGAVHETVYETTTLDEWEAQGGVLGRAHSGEVRAFVGCLPPHGRPEMRRKDLQDATKGIVTKPYVTHLRKGRIQNPGYENSGR